MLNLPFQKQIFMEMCAAESSLLVMGKGMGIDQILAAFLRVYADSRCLVFLVNAGEDLAFHQRILGTETPVLKVINSDIPAKERSTAYLQGGTFAVTSRIMVVDLLNDVIPTQLITGLLVHNAHSVSENSNEAFIVRMFRERNKEGFLQAFTDSPELVSTGFAHMEKLLRFLHLKKVFLWPRFEVSVADQLDSANIDLIQYRQPLSPRMAKIQQNCIAIIEACLSELKSSKSIGIDAEELTLEYGLAKNFDSNLMLHLDPIWHRIPFKVRQLVNDIRVLRKLLKFLIHYDCVTFHGFLNNVVTTECSTNGLNGKIVSPWLFMPESDAVFKLAKERVYKFHEQQIVPVLEPNPKWDLLKEIIAEIKQEMEANEPDREEQLIPIAVGPIVVFVADLRTQLQLEQVLASDADTDQEEGQPSAFLMNAWENFTKMNKRMRAMIANAKSTDDQDETVARPAAEPPQKKQRRRVRGGNSATNEEPFMGGGNSTLESEISRLESFFSIPNAEGQTAPSHNNSKVNVIPYGKNCGEHLHNLQEQKPRFVVVYDPDPSIVRTLEVYKASNPGLPLRVYFLIYENCVEEQRYLSAIKREQSAFESLIRDKANMAIQLEQDGKFAGTLEDVQLMSSNNALTRKAGGKSKATGATDQPSFIIVDVREFRSQLPFTCYKRGIKIIPMTIDVGDYILTPDICVERKSIPDLIGSINSGRLYSQVENMCVYYKTPVLLIEFDSEKSFTLQTSTETSYSDTSSNSLTAKLIMLTIQFPDLRILWSSSPHASAEIFQDLKQKQPNPDPEIVGAAGSGYLQKGSEIVNYTAIELLQRLPGMLPASYRYLIRDMKNLREVCNASKSTLETTLENKDKAKVLHAFLNKQV